MKLTVKLNTETRTIEHVQSVHITVDEGSQLPINIKTECSRGPEAGIHIEEEHNGS